MRAGELRHVIVVQEATAARDASGGKTYTWATKATIRAAYEVLTGREYFAANQETGESTARFKCRYYPGITTDMRVSWGSRYFDIERVDNPGGRAREIHLYVREVAD